MTFNHQEYDKWRNSQKNNVLKVNLITSNTVRRFYNTTKIDIIKTNLNDIPIINQP